VSIPSYARRVRAAIPLAVACAALFSASPVASSGDDVGYLLQRINAARTARHLRPLRLDSMLCRLASAHAADMAARHYFAHTTPEGQDPFARMAAVRYRFGYAAENLAVDRSIGSIARDFVLSPEHRANVLGPHYARVGIGAVYAPAGAIVVEDFSD